MIIMESWTASDNEKVKEMKDIETEINLLRRIEMIKTKKLLGRL